MKVWVLSDFSFSHVSQQVPGQLEKKTFLFQFNRTQRRITELTMCSLKEKKNPCYFQTDFCIRQGKQKEVK